MKCTVILNPVLPANEINDTEEPAKRMITPGDHKYVIVIAVHAVVIYNKEIQQILSVLCTFRLSIDLIDVGRHISPIWRRPC